jgi:hypothetical protein
MFFFKFILSCQQSDNCSHCSPQVLFTPVAICAGVADTGGNLPPASLTPVANFLPVSTTLAKMVAKFAAVVLDTSGKFAAGIVDR